MWPADRRQGRLNCNSSGSARPRATPARSTSTTWPTRWASRRSISTGCCASCASRASSPSVTAGSAPSINNAETAPVQTSANGATTRLACSPDGRNYPSATPKRPANRAIGEKSGLAAVGSVSLHSSGIASLLSTIDPHSMSRCGATFPRAWALFQQQLAEIGHVGAADRASAVAPGAA